MLNDNTRMSGANDAESTNWRNRQFVEGTPIYDANDNKIATVSEHNVQGGYLVAHKGLFFPKDVYIPLNAIQNADDRGVYLGMTKDQLENQNWDMPPQSGDAAYDLDAPDTDRSFHRPENLSGSGVAGTNVPVKARDDRSDRSTRMNAADTEMRDYAPPDHPTKPKQGDVALPLREEELVAEKRPVERGDVHLHKDVVAENKTLTEPVRREDVHVERVPVEGQAANNIGDDAFQERDIDVPVMGEELVAGKRARVAEEVHLHKDQVTDQQQVSDTVRRERAHIDEAGDETGNDTLRGDAADNTDRRAPRR